MNSRQKPESFGTVTHIHTDGFIKNGKQNIILADCKKEEIELFVKGLEEKTNLKFNVKSAECNGKRNLLSNLYRYIIYIFYPIKFFLKSKRINVIVCWQQFFGLFFAFYCNLFKVKKKNLLVVCNFTYKEKKGKIGKLYKKVMKFCVQNNYIDYIYVLSTKYAKICAEEFNIPIQKFVVIPFGLDDTYEKYKNSKVEYDNYTLAIGRSNRDYEFLIKVWKKMPIDEKLIIICDEYKIKDKLPKNIILRNDISFDFPYIANCKLMIIPIKDGNIASRRYSIIKSYVIL